MLRMRTHFGWIVLVVATASCASFKSQKTRSHYESYVWDHLHERTLSSEGRDLANARWLVLDDEYFAAREKLLGHDDILIKSAKDRGVRFLLLALQMKPSSLFSKSDVKVFWHGQEMKLNQEIVSQMQLRSLYPFAYPFHRVFLYEIPPSGVARLTIWTPWGTLEDEEKP